MKIAEMNNVRMLKSEDYNWLFNTITGHFIRWDKDMNDDPEYSPYGPEIMDIEISTVCSRACSWCYKSNTAKGKYMSFDTFKKMFDKFPKTVTQIAFGIGDIDGNPDLWEIMKYCRDNGVVPNITINGDRMTDEYYDKLVELCGAVAISHYDNDQVCFNAIKELSKRGLKQINIHKLLSEETFESCKELLDKKIDGLNAIVFLWLKPKGLRNNLHQLGSLKKYKELVEYAFDKKANIGFDSCSASSFLKAVHGRTDYESLKTMTEPCESTLFSYYINTEGMGFPCSFTEDESKGVDAVNCKDFLRDVWFAEETAEFRIKVMSNTDCNGCRMCQAFNLEVN